MNIVLGATGQVGSALLQELLSLKQPVRAVIRNPSKLSSPDIPHKIADYFNLQQLTEALMGGDTVFVLTPENPASQHILQDTKTIVENYKQAIQRSGIRRVIALSCVGAHIDGNTGNIQMSRMLEQALEELPIEKVFIRPTYYFSNWLGYWETIQQHGVLPTFFPEELKMDMHSPIDLAKFIAQVITNSIPSKKVYELVGPQQYSSKDVAAAFSKLLQKEVSVAPITQDKWIETLLSVGFTEDTALNLAAMTQAVVDNKTTPEKPEEVVKLPTSLEDYLKQQLKL